MAKASSRDKGSAARMRDSRDSADETPSGEEMAVSMENDDMETGVDEVAESPSASAVALVGDTAVTRGRIGATRAPARTGPPAAIMANPVTRFIWEAVQELRKVTWPRPQDAWNMTLVVVAMSAAVALLLGAADLGLTKALTFIVNFGTGGH